MSITIFGQLPKEKCLCVRGKLEMIKIDMLQLL